MGSKRTAQITRPVAATQKDMLIKQPQALRDKLKVMSWTCCFTYSEMVKKDCEAVVGATVKCFYQLTDKISPSLPGFNKRRRPAPALLWTVRRCHCCSAARSSTGVWSDALWPKTFDLTINKTETFTQKLCRHIVVVQSDHYAVIHSK